MFKRELLAKEFREDFDKYLKNRDHKHKQEHVGLRTCTRQKVSQGAFYRDPQNNTLRALKGGAVSGGFVWGSSPVDNGDTLLPRGSATSSDPENYMYEDFQGPLPFTSRRERSKYPPMQQAPSEGRQHGGASQREPQRDALGAPHRPARGSLLQEPFQGGAGCAVMQGYRSRTGRAERRWEMHAAGDSVEGDQAGTDKDSENNREGGSGVDEDMEGEYYRQHLPWCYHFEFERDLVPQKTPKTIETQKVDTRSAPRSVKHIKMHSKSPNPKS